MTITNFDDLHNWYLQFQKGEDPPTHWNLYSSDPGRPDTKGASNMRYDAWEDSWKMLENNIRMLNNPKGTRMRLQIFPKGKANNYTSQVILQIYKDGTVGSDDQQLPGAHSNIGMLPAGMGNINDYINNQVRFALLEKENEELRDAINGPVNMWERLLQTVADSPHLSTVANNLVMALAGKVNPGALTNMAPMPPTPVNGHPNTDADPNADPNEVFSNNMHQASNVLGVDPFTLAQKLNQLVQNNPEMAKQILNS